jgi:outer membrane protein assembly factor BamB
MSSLRERAGRSAAIGVLGLALLACTQRIAPPSAADGATASPASSTPAATTSVERLVPAPHQLPAPVERSVAAWRGSHLVIAGGLDAAGTSTDGVFTFAPSSGRLVRLGTMPTPFHDAAGGLLGRTLYVFGGGETTTVDTVQAFDLSTGRGSVVGHLPMPLSDLASATVGSTLYLAGGWDGTTPQAAVWSTTDGTSFTKLATLPAGVRYPAVAAAGSTLVVAGGLLANGHETAKVVAIDTGSGKVSKLPPLPRPVAHAMAFTADGTVYVAGGEDDVGTTQQRVTAIDPSATTTTAAPRLPVALSDAAVAPSTGGVTILGGSRFGTTTRTVLVGRRTTIQVAPTPTASPGAAAASAGHHTAVSTPYAAALPAAASRRPFGGLLLVADRGNDRLLVLNPAGKVVWQYPSPSLPAPPARFYFPDDAFWVHGGHAILVNEEENNLLAEIAYPSGRTLWTYGHAGVAGSSTGYVHQPDDLYPYPGGGLVVADAKNCRILFFDRGGHPSRQIGQTGTCTPSLPKTVGYPNGGTPLPNGDLLISEINGHTVSRVTKTGSVLWSQSLPGKLSVPSDPQLLTDGSILVVDYGHPGAVIRFRPDGHVLWYYRPTSGAGVLDHPSLAAPLPNGLVAVNDDYNHRIVLIDPKTDKIVWQYGHTGIAGTGPGYLNTPDGMDLLLPGGVVPLHVDFPTDRVAAGHP